MTFQIHLGRALLASLALTATACGGGGGGGGGGMANRPTTSQVTLASNGQFTLIAAGGRYDISAGTLSDVQQPTDGGGTGTITSDGLLVSVPARGLNVTIADRDRTGTFGAASVFQGTGYEAIFVTLDQMAYGLTLRALDPAPNFADVVVVAGGIRTPQNEIPTSGSATYTGGVVGFVGNSQADAFFAGRAALNVNFGARTISGVFNEMQTSDYRTGQVRPFNSMVVNGNWAPGTSTYSGSVQTTTNPGGPSALPTGASGPMTGTFFGAGANAARETGGTFLINSPTGVAAGAFGARR
jgi:hypothetical protein